MVQKVKIAAVIAEFNPLHDGHRYIINRAKELTGATHVLVVLSGNFVQRAEPAIIEKYQRAEEAVRAGADAVIEMPVAFATGNAEVFAKAGVKLAASFPHVTHLVFGTESRDLSLLKLIASTQVKREKDFERFITDHLKKGISFDRARCEVIKKLLPKIRAEVIEKTMNTPNNILAIEYLKELIRLGVSVTPVGVQRIDALSASELRKRILSLSFQNQALLNAPEQGKAPETVDNSAPQSSDINTLPPAVVQSYLDRTLSGIHYSMFEGIMLYSLMTKIGTNIYNSNTELVNLIKNTHPVSYLELKLKTPTKRFSVSRIVRLALHSALHVTKPDVAHLYKNTWLPYTNLLAINMDADILFSALCINAKTPLVVRGNKVKPKETHYYKTLKRIDERAELLYEAITGKRFIKRPRFVKM